MLRAGPLKASLFRDDSPSCSPENTSTPAIRSHVQQSLLNVHLTNDILSVRSAGDEYDRAAPVLDRSASRVQGSQGEERNAHHNNHLPVFHFFPREELSKVDTVPDATTTIPILKTFITCY